jgi:hypothetical protein
LHDLHHAEGEHAQRRADEEKPELRIGKRGGRTAPSRPAQLRPMPRITFEPVNAGHKYLPMEAVSPQPSAVSGSEQQPATERKSNTAIRRQGCAAN